MATPPPIEQMNAIGRDYLPGHLGIEFTRVDAAEVLARFEVTKSHMAPNGFLHAGSVVSLADSCCGYGAVAALPEGAKGFTTLELASNFIGTAREGIVTCRATPAHLGRTTQVWDATVTAEATGKTIAHFRCTQLVLWPRA